jgi:hypothetical protein
VPWPCWAWVAPCLPRRSPLLRPSPHSPTRSRELILSRLQLQLKIVPSFYPAVWLSLPEQKVPH